MSFKPKIFISSTFNLQKIRQKLESFFSEVGAEAMIYEANLTPSCEESAYKNEIKYADFVIFIFDEKYGTPTASGKSGTHEEFNIANDIKVPFHIYIKDKGEKEKKQKEFLANYIINKPYSWYQYKDEIDLLKRIKKTTFSIAKEIVNYRIEQDGIDYVTLNRLSFDYDYKTALKFIKSIECVLERYIINDFVYHNIVSTIFCDLNFYYDMKMLFLDRKIRELYKPIYLKSHRFFDIHSSYSVLRNGFVEDLSNNGVNIKISRLDVFDHKDNWEDTKQQLLQIANELINDYKIFRDEIFKLKQEFDIKGQI